MKLRWSPPVRWWLEQQAAGQSARSALGELKVDPRRLKSPCPSQARESIARTSAETYCGTFGKAFEFSSLQDQSLNWGLSRFVLYSPYLPPPFVAFTILDKPISFRVSQPIAVAIMGFRYAWHD